MPNNYLIHYASKYYDPVKAHEYYEEHKQLKGTSTSTAGLNSTGKEAAAYVKKTLNEERDSQISSEMETYTSEMNEKISALRESLSNMRPGDRKDNLLRVKREIAKLRKANEEKRAEITETYTNDYAQKYADEISSMKSDSAYTTSGSSSSSTSSTAAKSTKSYSRTELKAIGKQSADSLKKKK